MENSIFEYKMKVRDYECDAQGIVNNANYQHYYEVGRHEFLTANDLNFYELHKDGIDLVLISIHIRFLHALRGGEEFVCTVDSVQKEGVRYLFNQKIIRLADNKVCSEAKAEVVSVVNGRVSTPKVLDQAFSQYLQL